LAIQQMTAIVRVLDISSKVLILDEPTSSLNRNEVELLFDVIRKLRDQGLAIVFITHFLEQAYEIADRITVLRNGIVVGEYRTEDLPRYELISKMVGRDLAEKGLLEGESLKKAKSDPLPQGEVTLTASGLGKQGSINPFDIDIKSGEIVGVAGLLGSGRTEMVKLLFGVDRPDHGETRIRGERKRIASPGDAIALGMGFCPENRKEEGVVEELSLRENIILAQQGKMGIFRTIPERKQQEIAEKFIEVLDIQAHSTEQEVRTLSGGNQQKVMLARWLATEPEILFLDEPTRGIDVGAKVEIMDLIVRLREQGMAIVVVSSEFEEVISLSDRIVVLRDKSKVAELSGDEIAEENILQTIAGGS
jgi:simple sugar transport system ATP-binding protein